MRIMRYQVCSTLVLNCRLAGIDYTDPRSVVGGGVVLFNPALGLLSTTLTIPIPSDNIAEGTEYFGLSFVAITNGDELGIMPVEPTMAMVAIIDTNGECSLTRCMGVFCQHQLSYQTITSLW